MSYRILLIALLGLMTSPAPPTTRATAITVRTTTPPTATCTGYYRQDRYYVAPQPRYYYQPAPRYYRPAPVPQYRPYPQPGMTSGTATRAMTMATASGKTMGGTGIAMTIAMTAARRWRLALQWAGNDRGPDGGRVGSHWQR
jgi:hypothetical protein